MKNKKGFTLVEVIISIAALGIICAVLLRLFVLAGGINKKAGITQQAEMFAASHIETLLCADTLGTGLGALGISTLGVLAEGRHAVEQDGYTLLIEYAEKQDGYPGKLYDISVKAMHEDEVLARIRTAKYYKERPDG